MTSLASDLPAELMQGLLRMIPFMDEQATHLFRMTGADLTQIDGIDVGSLTYDSDPSGGGHVGEVLYPKRCPEPIHLWINASGHINCFRQETSYPKMLCRRTLGRTKGQPRSNGHEMGLCSSAFHLAARVTDWRLSLGALGAGSHRSGCGVLEENIVLGSRLDLMA